MTPADLKELLDAATPGPWAHGDVDGMRFDLHYGDPRDMNGVATCGGFDDGGFEKEGDARLCAALRNLAPLLVHLWEASERMRTEIGIGPTRSGFEQSLEALREAKP